MAKEKKIKYVKVPEREYRQARRDRRRLLNIKVHARQISKYLENI